MNIENMFYITEQDWYKLQAWATLAYEEDKNEISGLMTAVPQKDGRIKVGDVEILKQENSGANTELDGDAVASYKMKYAMKHKNPEMKFVWWHSHHKMEAFWSGTDKTEIDAWENNSYSLALVINLKEEYKFRISVWKANGLPMAEHIDTDLTIEYKQPKINITEAMKKQYEELCSDKTVTVGTGYTRYHNGKVINSLNTGSYSTQMTLGNVQKRESHLNIEQAFQECSKKIENAVDAFMDGSIKGPQLRKEVDKANDTCKKHSLPFSLNKDLFTGKEQEVMETLMTTTVDDFFTFDDPTLETKLLYGGYNYGWY